MRKPKLKEVLVVITIAFLFALIIWIGLREEACVQAMALVRNSNGIGYICGVCNVLQEGGIIPK